MQFFLAHLSILYMPPAAFTMHRVALVVTQATQTAKISAICPRNRMEHTRRV